MGVINGAGVPVDSPVGVPLIGYNNIVSSSNISTSTAQTAYPAINLANVGTHLKWQGQVNTGDEYLTVQNGSRVPMNYVAIAKHNFGTIGATLSVEVQNDSPAVFTEVVAPTLITDNSAIIMRFPTTTPYAARVRIQALEQALPEAGVMYAGQLLVLERSITVETDHVPINYGRVTQAVSGMSENGQFLGRMIIGEYRQSRAEFKWFTDTFYRASIDPFLIAAQGNPFFWAWSPVEYPLETGFAWLTADAQPAVHPATRRIMLTLDMRGLA